MSTHSHRWVQSLPLYRDSVVNVALQFIKDTPKAFFLILNNFEFFNIRNV